MKNEENSVRTHAQIYQGWYFLSDHFGSPISITPQSEKVETHSRDYASDEAAELKTEIQPTPTPDPQASYDAFVQALEVILNGKPFTQADFININAQNDMGMAPLHIAALLNDRTLASELIRCGANIQIQDNFGRAPLELAKLMHHDSVIQTIFNVKLSQYDDILKFSDFTLYKAKNDGITVGGFYHDQEGGSWLLKEGHYHDAKSIGNEYIAGGLYQLFLGENAPQTEMVIDDMHHQLLTGSKLLENFKTLSAHYTIDYNNYSDGWTPYGKDFPFTFNGKKITGFFDAISAINFMSDTDAHAGNTGLIDHGDYYSFAKIDHGFSFQFYQDTISLDNFRGHLKSFYQIDKMENLGFDEIYQSINKIAEIDFSKIENIVTEKFTHIKTHMDILDLKLYDSGYDYYDTSESLDDNIKLNQDKLLSHLKNHHEQYQKMADFMSFEKAILDHNPVKLLDHLEKGTSLQEPFKPFFNPTYDYGMGWGVETKSVTGLELIEKNWPDILESFMYQTETSDQILSAKDVLSQKSDTLDFGQATPANAMVPHIEMNSPIPLMAPHELPQAAVHVDFA